VHENVDLVAGQLGQHGRGVVGLVDGVPVGIQLPGQERPLSLVCAGGIDNCAVRKNRARSSRSSTRGASGGIASNKYALASRLLTKPAQHSRSRRPLARRPLSASVQAQLLKDDPDGRCLKSGQRLPKLSQRRHVEADQLAIEPLELTHGHVGLRRPGDAQVP
jgi:hypothetical protein